MEPTPRSLDGTFFALADPTRRAILAHLAKRDCTVTEVGEPFPISLQAICRHLNVLENAGLIARDRKKRVHLCRLQAGPMKEVAQWIAHYRRFWESQMDSLARYLEEPAKEESRWTKPKTRSGSSVRSARRQKKSSGRGPIRGN